MFIKLSARRRRQAREAAERAKRERLDLTRGRQMSPLSWTLPPDLVSFNAIVRTMEISLARQGQQVWLSVADLASSYRKLTRRRRGRI